MKDFGRYTSSGSREQRKRRVGRTSLVPLLSGALAVILCLGVFSFDPELSSGRAGDVDNAAPERLDDEPRELAARGLLDDEAFDVLAVGVDRRPDGGSEGMGVRSDTIMLARVFPESGEVRLLSIPRDLFVEVSPGYEDRINAAYAYGGMDQAIRAVENYTDIEIDHYAIVDFEGFEDVVDALGGVRVNVEDEYPPESRIEETGEQTLDGEQALFYARYRGTAGGDLDRIERQQEIIAALKREVLGIDSITKLPDVIGAVEENVETDVGLGDSFSLARVLMDRGDEKEGGVEAAKLVGVPTTLEDGRQVLIPDDEENRRIIGEYKR